MNNEFIVVQFCTSTAEDEKNYFTGDPAPDVVFQPEQVMPVGLYRIIDGEVFRVTED